MESIEGGKRLLSLDVFRGLTIAGMIIVNNAGSWQNVYPPLRHAEWHGWTLTDLIFPFFLFIAGVSISFSFSKRFERGVTKKGLWYHIIIRSLVLFFLGLFLAFIFRFDFTTLRIPGVLQRIAVCYFFTSVIVMKTRIRGRTITGIVLLLIYWAAMRFIPVPGYGAGNLSFEGNACGYIDRLLLQGHLYKPGFDPEGILSTLPSIVTMLIGVHAGDFIRKGRTDYEITTGIFAWGTLMIIGGKIWSIWMPINKQLWTISYTLFTTGMASVLLALMYWLIEIKNVRKWGFPFAVFGTNAITAYFLSSLVAKALYSFEFTLQDGSNASLKSILYTNVFKPVGNPEFNSFFFALCYTMFWFLIMYILYRKRIFIKI